MNIRIRLTFFILFIIFGQSNLLAQKTDCCHREAVLYCTYEHFFMSAPEKEKIEKEFSAAVFAKFSEIFNRKCFQVIPPVSLDASNPPQNEYQIEVTHTQVTDITNTPNTRIEAILYFVAQGFSEQVYSWQVEEVGDSLSIDKISWKSFLEKLANKINNGPDITELIEKCEKQPVTFDLGCDNDEFEPGETVSVYLYGFKDKYGETSRWFNRIVVQVSSGEILNGATCDLGPDYYAYKVDRNTIEVKYKAAEDCHNPSVKFTIYNSCDILREQDLYMSKTQTKDRLKEKDFALKCYDAKININGKYHKTLITDNKDPKGEYIHKRNIVEATNATATIYLKLLTTQEIPFAKQTWKYYQPTGVSVTSFSHSLKGNEYIAVQGSETTITSSSIPKNYKIEGEEYLSNFPPWMLVIDNETKKAVKLIPAGYAIEYEYIEKTETKSTDKTGTHYNTETKNRQKTFELGPVGEEIPDPTIKKSDNWIQDYMKEQAGVDIPASILAQIPKVSNEETIKKIPPDILVKNGDGKTKLSGNGERTIHKEITDGYEETNLHYDWKMEIKGDNKNH